MDQNLHHPEARADRLADRRAWVVMLLFLVGSFVVEAATVHDEALRRNPNASWSEPYLQEGLSHLAIGLSALMIPFILSRAPLQMSRWYRVVPLHIAGSLVFSAVHILLMYSSRKLLYPLLLDGSYHFDISNIWVWLYEYRKDAFGYAAFVFGFAISRALEQQRLEAETARTEARTGHRVTLKSGGKTFFVDANDIISASAASNYVEIETRNGRHLARSTLTALERLLAEAGGRHLRVHRSHLVNLDEILALEPNGEGDLVIRLENGTEIPGSRRYRAALETALEESSRL